METRLGHRSPLEDTSPRPTRGSTWRLCAARARRCYDDEGKAYIDMGSGIAVNVLGYGNSRGRRPCASRRTNWRTCPTSTTRSRRANWRRSCASARGMKKVVFRQFRRGGQRVRHQGRAQVRRRQARRKRKARDRHAAGELPRAHARDAGRHRAGSLPPSTFGPFPEGFRACAAQRCRRAESCAQKIPYAR